MTLTLFETDWGHFCTTGAPEYQPCVSGSPSFLWKPYGILLRPLSIRAPRVVRRKTHSVGSADGKTDSKSRIVLGSPPPPIHCVYIYPCDDDRLRRAGGDADRERNRSTVQFASPTSYDRNVNSIVLITRMKVSSIKKQILSTISICV